MTAVDEKMVSMASNAQGKVTVEDVCELLPDFLIEPKTRQQLLDYLCDELGRSPRNIEGLLKEIVTDRVPITSHEGSIVLLSKTKTNPVEYRLEPVLTFQVR